MSRHCCGMGARKAQLVRRRAFRAWLLTPQRDGGPHPETAVILALTGDCADLLSAMGRTDIMDRLQDAAEVSK